MDFTLLIPTFNRPEWLAMLLGYLARSGLEGKVLILDSSGEEAAARNRALAAAAGLSATIRSYPESIPFAQKLLDGVTRVDTSYCGLCADDDLVIPAAVTACLEFLRSNADHVGAHGLYFAFSEDDRRYFVDEIVYGHPSLDAGRPIERLAQLLDDYQSNFYAVYRTSVQADALAVAAENDSSLFFELAQSALTAVSGKVTRLPLVYAGRRRSPSAGSPTKWHPVEWAAAEPADLMDRYVPYRERVLERIGPDHRGVKFASAFDLMHLRYLLESIRGPGLKAAISAHLEGCARGEIVARAFAGASHPLAGLPGFPSSRLWRTYFALRGMAEPGRRFANRAIGRLRRPVGGARLRHESGGVEIKLNAPVPDQIRSQAPGTVDGAIAAIFESLRAYAVAAPGGG